MIPYLKQSKRDTIFFLYMVESETICTLVLFFLYLIKKSRLMRFGSGSGDLVGFLDNWHSIFSVAKSFLSTLFLFPSLLSWSRCH